MDLDNLMVGAKMLITILTSEAGQSGVQHELDQIDEGVGVGSDHHVGLDTQLHEPFELRRLHLASHDIDELLGQLHVGLEGHVTPGAALEHEAEVDVDDVALLVHHDVAVVSVLDLQQELEDAVSRHGGDEVPPGGLESRGGFVSVFLEKVGVEVGVRLPAQLVPGLGVRDALDDATARLGGHHFVGEQVEVQPGLLEGVLAELDDLEGQDVLPAVVPDLEQRTNINIYCKIVPLK